MIELVRQPVPRPVNIDPVVNIADVAADAGVSKSTVSYVLSGTRKISPETVKRVQESIRRLGYRPNPAARALTLKRTGIIGLLANVGVDDASADAETFMQFVQEALFGAHRRGYDLIVMGNGEDELRGDVLADALVMMDVKPDERRLETLAGVGVPATLLGMPEDRRGFFAVDLDFEAAGRMLIEHLRALGHDAIGFMGLEPGSDAAGYSFTKRFERGLADRAQELGAVLLRQPLQPGMTMSGWWSSARALLPRMSAIITPGPSQLDELYPYLAGLGVGVPDDISVVTVATERRLRRATVPTTGVILPMDDMVGIAVDHAINAIEGVSADEAILISPTLLELGSSAVRSRRSGPGFPSAPEEHHGALHSTSEP
jgi:LacI family transcriptional regulator